MKIIQFSEARANFSKVLDQIESDAEETVITRSGHDSTVLLSLREYEAMKENLYLLKGENGRVLRERAADMNARRNSAERELVDEGDGQA
jgi:antitoxin YefM